MTVVETAYGKVRGTEIADGVLAWRGIAYAAPPVGELRLRPPVPPAAWAGVRDALAYGNRSLQPEPDAMPPVPLPLMAEDCLYLNVTAPANAVPASVGAPANGGGRPVLLWIHGGGYEMGHGPDQAGDGAAFARSHGLVVVTFNYRLGALGFLDVPGEAPTGALGLHDQVAALRWTGQNIAAFGGDPEQITVYGLSAGGKSVTNLLASPLTKGLVRRAAESSGGDHVKSPEQARDLAGRYFETLGTTPERVRAVPAADILAAQLAVADPTAATWVWRPSVDGTALTVAPLTAIAAGSAAGVPLLLQTCSRETVSYQLMDPRAAAQADRVLTGYFGEQRAARIVAAYAAAYPGQDDTELRGVTIMTDERYVVRTERLADAHAAHAPVWRSRYDGPYTGMEDDPDPEFAKYAPLLNGAHGADATAIWQGGAPLSEALHIAWAEFTTHGTPGWPQYTPEADRQTMIFTEAPDGPHLEGDAFKHPRKTWEGLTWQPGPWWHVDGVS